MKKTRIVAAIVILGIAAWAGTAWYTGQRVEDEIRSYVEQLDEQGAIGQLRISSYERGLFSSTVRYSLTTDYLPLPGGLVQPGDEIGFISEVGHGPFPWVRLRNAEFAPVLAATRSTLENNGPVARWFAAAGGEQPMQEQSSIHYDGHVDFSLRFAPLVIEEPELEFESTEALITGRTDTSLDVLKFTGALDTVRMRTRLSEAAGAEPDSLALQGLTFEADSRIGKFDVYLGQAKAGIKKLSLDATDNDGRALNIVLNDYLITSGVSEDETHVSGNLEYGIGTVQISNVDLGSLQALVRFGHLDGQALKDIMARYRELTPQLMAEMANHPADSDDLPPLLASFLDDSLKALLPGEPTFGLDPLRWSLSGAESSLRLNALLQQVPDTDDLLRTVRSVDAALVVSQHMVVELLTRLAQMPGSTETLTAEQAADAARLSFGLFKQMALATGYVVAEGDNLVARVSYADGQVKLNGAQIPLEELLRGLPVAR